MKNMDEASIQKLNEAISYLKDISEEKLMIRLYQKIIFLLELEHYKKFDRLFIGVPFVSYKYGPFSIEIAKNLENPNKIKCSKEVKEHIDEILRQYKLNNFDNKTMGKAFNKMIKHIHSLVFYNLTPFNASLDFDLYTKEQLFESIDSDLNGEKLEKEKACFRQIRHKSKEYECLFVT